MEWQEFSAVEWMIQQKAGLAVAGES